jgi:hypothetical protein
MHPAGMPRLQRYRYGDVNEWPDQPRPRDLFEAAP